MQVWFILLSSRTLVMKRESLPTWEELERHARVVREIHPAAVVTMLELRQAGEEIQKKIMDVLQKEHHLSEGKFCALVVLHQHLSGLAPSQLAERVGVARASVTGMLRQMEQDGWISLDSDAKDGRGKIVCLTDSGREFIERVLPPHYLRVTHLMENLTEKEQFQLIHLIHKLLGVQENENGSRI